MQQRRHCLQGRKEWTTGRGVADLRKGVVLSSAFSPTSPFASLSNCDKSKLICAERPRPTSRCHLDRMCTTESVVSSYSVLRCPADLMLKDIRDRAVQHNARMASANEKWMRQKRTLHVGNVPNAVDGATLLTLFQPYGSIEDLRAAGSPPSNASAPDAHAFRLL